MKKLFFIPVVLLLILFGACSTQKNTIISRSYHNLTAHFNVYFNGNESYKKGVARYNLAFRDDYSRILPVFNYGNKEVAGTISSDMDVAQKKASKLITLHSIKVKPKMKRGKLSPKEKQILNTNEFNKWVDEAYLLIGKANFYIMDYDKSYEAFAFTVREFPKDISFYVAQIWIARLYCEKGEYRDADKVLTLLEADKKLPKKLKFDYYSTVAHLALKQEQYTTAIKMLNKALPYVKGKKTKLRFYYILAQLYQHEKRYDDATEMYTKVIRKNPPYEMTFNARINLASLVQAGSKSNKDIKQQLLKMARDDKNIDYLDQVYYAIGNVEMIDGNVEEAIENYKKSSVVSRTNTDQKALSCLTLADIYYKRKDYVPAQAYYDSTLQSIDKDYAGIENIEAKASSLGHLVENLNTISTQDSLQKVAKLSESERFRLIDKIIADLRKSELESQMDENQRLQDYYRGQSRQNVIPGQQTNAKWYFYNTVSVNQGIKEFQLRWGRRKFEDNWRRKNKSANVAISPDSQEADKDETIAKEATTADKKLTDNTKREYYLQNVPLTDSALVESKRKVIDAYYFGGLVYRNEIKDLPPAAELYEEMLKRFPENDYKLPVYYQLYIIYKELNKIDRSDYYKNIILSQYPTSTFAQVITDPEFYKQVEAKDKEASRYYELTYNLYESNNYAQVIANANDAFQRFPSDKTLPNFALLRALSYGRTGNLNLFREELNKVITTYPNLDVASHAKEVIAYLNTYNPETKVVEDIKKAEIIYSDTVESKYLFVVLLSKTEDLNQISFDIINYNLDNFPNEKFEITREEVGKEYKLLTIRSFSKLDSIQKYYNIFSTKIDVLKNVKSDKKEFFYITPTNFDILLKQTEADTYLQFFKLHFLQPNAVK